SLSGPRGVVICTGSFSCWKRDGISGVESDPDGLIGAGELRCSQPGSIAEAAPSDDCDWNLLSIENEVRLGSLFGPQVKPCNRGKRGVRRAAWQKFLEALQTERADGKDNRCVLIPDTSAKNRASTERLIPASFSQCRPLVPIELLPRSVELPD